MGLVFNSPKGELFSFVIFMSSSCLMQESNVFCILSVVYQLYHLLQQKNMHAINRQLEKRKKYSWFGWIFHQNTINVLCLMTPARHKRILLSASIFSQSDVLIFLSCDLLQILTHIYILFSPVHEVWRAGITTLLSLGWWQHHAALLPTGTKNEKH